MTRTTGLFDNEPLRTTGITWTLHETEKTFILDDKSITTTWCAFFIITFISSNTITFLTVLIDGISEIFLHTKTGFCKAKIRLHCRGISPSPLTLPPEIIYQVLKILTPSFTWVRFRPMLFGIIYLIPCVIYLFELALCFRIIFIFIRMVFVSQLSECFFCFASACFFV